jgi:NADPH-dependent 2,4-dienoyl-CoA reductase/sulfur reductase-like enzyme/rhodanese-related sulfurtransferase
MLTGAKALDIDRAARTIRVRNLATQTEEHMPYDKLVLATGAHPFRPPVGNLGLRNVWFLTHPDEAAGLKKAIAEEGFRSAVLVGAGFIGVEVAEALVLQGIEVTLVEMCDQIMPGVLDEDIALITAKYLRQKGVKIVLGEKVVSFEGIREVSAVRTERQQIRADVVIVAAGFRPNDELAREAGLSCSEKGGIIIDEYCRTSDPDIYAGGDCALNRYVDHEIKGPFYTPLGSTANKHGRAIANHIAGLDSPFSGISLTAVVRAFDFTVGKTGLTERQARDLDLKFETFILAGPDKPHYMADSRPLIIKMIASRKDRKLLGVQVAGPGNGSKRIDVAAAMILMGATLEQVADIDFGYAPPFGPPLDPLAASAHMLMNKLEGIAEGISSLEAKEKIDRGEVFLLDVRTPQEVEAMQLPYGFVNIPLGALRNRLAELPRDKEILTYCKISLRGYEAQRILNAAGFKQVRFIEGGIVGWPYEVKIKD